MNMPTMPRFECGQPVTASVDLFNDGSYPDQPVEVLLVGTGTAGEVVQVGLHEESNTAVYMVEFVGGKVVGCLEQEIEAR